MAERVGVLVMAHGTPTSPQDIEAFFTRIRGGRPPSPEALAELESRYRAIGGTSPLAGRTRAQVEGLARRLEQRRANGFVVRFGAKHTEPSIEAAAAELASAHLGHVVTLVLTPQWSSMGAGEYLRRAEAALGARVTVHPVPQWHLARDLVALWAQRVRQALGAAQGKEGSKEAPVVIFTAHSLPCRIREHQDPYESQVQASAAAVAAEAGLARWQVAFQSAGRTPEPWIGPALDQVLPALASSGVTQVVVCPIGFVSDHLEVLYDIDIEAQAVARAAGLTLVRTQSLNDDPRLLEVLADVVEAAADRPGIGRTPGQDRGS